MRLATDLFKKMVASTGIFRKNFFSRYPYMFEPDQLYMLMQLLRRTKNVEGCYVEVGCAYGSTTILLKKYMDRLGIKRRCIALDTFEGFVKEHADYDINVLKKDASLKKIFSVNKKEWFIESLKVDNVTGVDVVAGDASLFDFGAIAPIAFCLIDVDLYKPIKTIMPKAYMNLSPGGIIVVDDCKPHPLWGGALLAYEEFMSDNGFEPKIVAEQFGIIKYRGCLPSYSPG